jgi:predicted nucleotide-binding protein (sugar kinase/HSP70/actin superfamily)
MIFMQDLIKRRKLADVALFSLSSDNAYAGLENDFHKKGWWAIVTSDLMEDIRSMLLANADDPAGAMSTFDEQWRLVLDELEEQGRSAAGDFSLFEKQLVRTGDRLARIPLKKPVEAVPVIALLGEIFVRRDGLSRRYITEHLAQNGFAAVCAPVSEWIYYTDWLVDNQYAKGRRTLKEKLSHKLKQRFSGRYEKRIRHALGRSGLIHSPPVNVPLITKNASPYISPDHWGEAILTVGSAITEVVSHTCGVIAIGPFGCMPNRISEAILNEVMRSDVKIGTDPANKRLRAILDDVEELPFLAIESDGSPFPQVINAKLEAFCLRAQRLHTKMAESDQTRIGPAPHNLPLHTKQMLKKH